MLGVPNDINKQGIIPRALEHIFETAANDNKYNYEIRIAYLQIYMEIVISNSNWQFSLLLVARSDTAF